VTAASARAWRAVAVLSGTVWLMWSGAGLLMLIILMMPLPRAEVPSWQMVAGAPAFCIVGAVTLGVMLWSALGGRLSAWAWIPIHAGAALLASAVAGVALLLIPGAVMRLLTLAGVDAEPGFGPVRVAIAAVPAVVVAAVASSSIAALASGAILKRLALAGVRSDAAPPDAAPPLSTPGRGVQQRLVLAAGTAAAATLASLAAGVVLIVVMAGVGVAADGYVGHLMSTLAAAAAGGAVPVMLRGVAATTGPEVRASQRAAALLIGAHLVLALMSCRQSPFAVLLPAVGRDSVYLLALPLAGFCFVLAEHRVVRRAIGAWAWLGVASGGALAGFVAMRSSEVAASWLASRVGAELASLGWLATSRGGTDALACLVASAPGTLLIGLAVGCIMRSASVGWPPATLQRRDRGGSSRPAR
jgi:hypothetical protein